MNFQIQGLLDLLKAYGPLWVNCDSSTATQVSLHARVLTGMYGDGGPDDTYVLVNDPADG
jgi:hypothetical protein